MEMIKRKKYKSGFAATRRDVGVCALKWGMR